MILYVIFYFTVSFRCLFTRHSLTLPALISMRGGCHWWLVSCRVVELSSAGYFKIWVRFLHSKTWKYTLLKFMDSNLSVTNAWKVLRELSVCVSTVWRAAASWERVHPRTRAGGWGPQDTSSALAGRSRLWEGPEWAKRTKSLRRRLPAK